MPLARSWDPVCATHTRLAYSVEVYCLSCTVPLKVACLSCTDLACPAPISRVSADLRSSARHAHTLGLLAPGGLLVLHRATVQKSRSRRCRGPNFGKLGPDPVPPTTDSPDPNPGRWLAWRNRLPSANLYQARSSLPVEFHLDLQTRCSSNPERCSPIPWGHGG